jgi:TetR/AcrR family transcriptional regulator
MVKAASAPRAPKVRKIRKTPKVLPANAQARILDAARAEFIAKGFAGARMQAIAKGAGVNHALLHYYFGSKENLYEAAVKDKIRIIWGGAQAELEGTAGQSFEMMLTALLKLHARNLSRHPEFVLFLLRDVGEGRGIPMGIAELFRTFGQVPRRIQEALAVEIKAGRLRPIEPVHFWLNLTGMVVSAFLASQIVKHLGPAAPFPRPEFSEKFFLERAEVVAKTMVNSLRPDFGGPGEIREQEIA